MERMFIVSPTTRVWNHRPSSAYLMGWEDKKENDLDNDDPEELIILNRTAKKMTPEKQKKLLEIAKIMFAEDFKKNE